MKDMPYDTKLVYRVVERATDTRTGNTEITASRPYASPQACKGLITGHERSVERDLEYYGPNPFQYEWEIEEGRIEWRTYDAQAN